MKYWRSFILGIVCFFLVSSYFVPVVLSNDGEVQIINLASETVRNGELEVCNQRFKLGAIERGKSRTINYKIKSDSHYKLVVEFKSGRKFEKELGYVTNGRDFKDVLTLSDDDVSLKEQ
jgi:hypothetical protein